MVTVVNYQSKKNSEGKAFFTLTVQGEPELIISKNGKPYLASPKASLMTALDETLCARMVGKDLPGEITVVDCAPYEITTEDGEVVTKTTRNEYLPEAQVYESENAVFEDLVVQVDPFANLKPVKAK